jgi:poly(A) polymerase
MDNGRLVRDNVYGSVEDDAVRRDFTVNALYYAIADFSVRDFVGGYEDVQARVLRLIGDPEERYREDPVRMLRAVRLAAKLEFEIADSSSTPIEQLAELLNEASSARLFDESLKLFLAGHGERSYLELERRGLLGALLPDTAAALAADRSGVCRRMLLRALANTDARVNADKSVTPAYLFAALMWPAYARELQGLLESGHDLAAAEQRAADRITLRQMERIALPRRFSVPMHEIWWLQSRFGLRQRKRVFRLLSHPRFRAAYDFLELRAAVVPELGEELAWWREAQGLPPDELAGRLTSANTERDPGPPRKRRRRRSGRGKGPVAGGE